MFKVIEEGLEFREGEPIGLQGGEGVVERDSVCCTCRMDFFVAEMNLAGSA